MGVEVLGPKGPTNRYGGVDLLDWARDQLRVAGDIIDNPGGGLLFATQTIGQVSAGLEESDPARWEAVVSVLERAEAHAVRREFAPTRQLLARAREKLV